MIGFNSYYYDLNGDFILNPTSESNLFKVPRRYQRVATLDGGMAFEYRGQFDADRQITLVVPFDATLKAKLDEHIKWRVSTPEGSFIMLLAGWDVTDKGIVLTLEGL